MTRTRSEELGLATALASTTDRGRAEILAEMEGDKAPKAKPKEKPKEKTSDKNPVKVEMARQEEVSAVDRAWGKVHQAVSAAQEACRKDKEADADEDPKAYFKEHVGHLIDVLEEMRDTEDVFKEMAKVANTTKLY